REHADHGRRISIEQHAPAHDGTVSSKPGSPVIIGQHDSAFARGVFVRGVETAPQRRLNAEDRQKTMRHGNPPHLLRLAQPRYRPAVAGPYADILKDPVLLAIGKVERCRKAQFLDVDTWRGMH